MPAASGICVVIAVGEDHAMDGRAVAGSPAKLVLETVKVTYPGFPLYVLTGKLNVSHECTLLRKDYELFPTA